MQGGMNRMQPPRGNLPESVQGRVPPPPPTAGRGGPPPASDVNANGTQPNSRPPFPKQSFGAPKASGPPPSSFPLKSTAPPSAAPHHPQLSQQKPPESPSAANRFNSPPPSSYKPPSNAPSSFNQPAPVKNSSPSSFVSAMPGTKTSNPPAPVKAAIVTTPPVPHKTEASSIAARVVNFGSRSDSYRSLDQNKPQQQQQQPNGNVTSRTVGVKTEDAPASAGRPGARKMSFHANRILPSAEVVDGKSPEQTLARYKEREEELKKKLKMIIQRVTTERAEMHKTISDHEARAAADATRITVLEQQVQYLQERLAKESAAGSAASQEEKEQNAHIYERMVKAEESLQEESNRTSSLRKRVQYLEAQAEIQQASIDALRVADLASERNYDSNYGNPFLTDEMLEKELDNIQIHHTQSTSQSTNTTAASTAAPTSPPGGFVRANPTAKMLQDQPTETLPNSTTASKRNGKAFNRQRPNLLAKTDYFPGPDAPDDLQFTEGDLMHLVHPMSEGWLVVEDLNGRSGRIPVDYVIDLEQLPRSPPMRVVADFGGEIAGDLHMRRDDVVCILVMEDDWWVGELPDGSIGYVPSNFVQPI
ncbi:voltage gated chloride channel domain-containing protein [Planoprotostelium fungivorum]|uniref:Voltage gated chloride channel domain-containing protein n=1 Tax=Planoprotostelium fungivorum TaxID=1890364 RepID=A0A2P6NI71_9EUKA|nr:voltage gated chloride channel domain-containing protein [Planoprotostelium fungivorum]